MAWPGLSKGQMRPMALVEQEAEGTMTETPRNVDAGESAESSQIWKRARLMQV